MKFKHACKLVTWVEHLHRHVRSPSFRLLQSQDGLCLETCRYLVGHFGKSRTPKSGEIYTRSGPGFPMRWAGGWVAKIGEREGGWENARKDKGISKERASFLIRNFMNPVSPQSALDGG